MWKATCPEGKSSCPRQPDGTFIEPCGEFFCNTFFLEIGISVKATAGFVAWEFDEL